MEDTLCLLLQMGCVWVWQGEGAADSCSPRRRCVVVPHQRQLRTSLVGRLWVWSWWQQRDFMATQQLHLGLLEGR
jgi:hypothetical protein